MNTKGCLDTRQPSDYCGRTRGEGGTQMDIWTERLQRRHLPLLEGWVCRADGAVTPNDLPERADALAQWYDAAAAQPGRLDCLTLVYETPVGVAGLLPLAGQPDTAELYLLLGEVGYNLLRTATYVTIRMLDRAFQDLGLARVTLRADPRRAQLMQAFARMGFSGADAPDGLRALSVESDVFRQRKHLF